MLFVRERHWSIRSGTQWPYRIAGKQNYVPDSTRPNMHTVKGRVIFVTYAAGAFTANLARNGWWVRWFMRADKLILLTRSDLEADPIYAPHRAVFDATRGAGYWAWKPWAIRCALNECQAGDVVVYQDCGFGLRYKNLLPIRALAQMARREGYVAGVVNPAHGSNRRWSHRHCVMQTGELTPEYLDHPTIEAAVSLWTGASGSVAFVDEWLTHCLNLAIVGEPPNTAEEDPSFVEHRYDQAVLANLAIKRKAPLLRPDTAALPFAKSLMLLEIAARAKQNRGWARVYAGMLAALGLRACLPRRNDA
jgi:hypothetical protein